MTGDRSEAGNAEHVTRRPPKAPPPCPERCWCWLYRLHDSERVAWVFTETDHCTHDPESKQWTECEGAK